MIDTPVQGHAEPRSSCNARSRQDHTLPSRKSLVPTPNSPPPTRKLRACTREWGFAKFELHASHSRVVRPHSRVGFCKVRVAPSGSRVGRLHSQMDRTALASRIFQRSIGRLPFREWRPGTRECAALSRECAGPSRECSGPSRQCPSPSRKCAESISRVPDSISRVLRLISRVFAGISRVARSVS